MQLTKEQLSDEHHRLMAARSKLFMRQNEGQQRLSEIEQEYPALLVEYANGTKAAADLQALEMEKIQLTAAAQAPYNTAAKQFDDRMKAVRLALDNINNIERLRKQDADFGIFFNTILRRRSLQAGDEEQLRSYACNQSQFKEPVDRLIDQLNDFSMRGYGATPVPFEQIVTVPELPEEPDTSEISISL